MFKEFKAFVLRGNVVDLAVAVVIGTAFGAVVNSFVKNLLTPLVSLPGKTNFNDLHLTVHGSVFAYGTFLNDVISFVLIAAAVFFFVVKPLNYITDRRRRGEPEPETDERPCPECLSPIPKAAARCAFCTSVVTPAR